MPNSQNFNIVDTTRHPLSSRGILNWIIWRWGQDPGTPLLVIVESLEAKKMDSRLRVLLATTRKGLKNSGHFDIVQFGIRSTISHWADPDLNPQEALCLHRVVTMRMRFIEHFASENAS